MLLILIGRPSTLKAQAATLDSLRAELLIAYRDSTKLNIYLEFASTLLYNDPQLSIYYAQKAADSALEMGDQNKLAISHNSMGIACLEQGKYLTAIEHFQNANQAYAEAGNKEGEAIVQNNIGVLHNNLGDYKESMKHFEESAKLSRQIGDYLGQAISLCNVMAIHIFNNELAEAQHTMLIVEDLIEQNHLNFNISAQKAEYYLAAGKLDAAEIAVEEALSSAQISRKNFDKQKLYLVKSKISASKGQLQSAKGILLNAEQNCLQNGYTSILLDLYQQKADLYGSLSDFKVAYEAQKNYIQLKDSIESTQSYNRFTELDAKYTSEKKENEILEQQQIIAEGQELIARKKNQSLIFIIILVIFILSLIAAMVLLQKKKKTNLLLKKQNEEIKVQRKKIISSIDYAKKIQNSILIKPSTLKEHFAESFIFNKPKDIVSGDFHWFMEKDNEIILAAVDCTGHGVPGAFMSLIANSKLNKIINEKNILVPGEILEALHGEIIHSLQQSTYADHAQDGMDISICRINQAKSSLQIAGANSNVYLIQDGQTNEVKTDGHSIGGVHTKYGLKNSQHFQTHEISYKSGDYLILSTDGFMDQFGGKEHKKLNKKRFMDFLMELSKQDFSKGAETCETFFNGWRGDSQQLDDILMIGAKL